MNIIDLEYLGNPIYSTSKMSSRGAPMKKEDLNFYKIRIYQMTKDLVLGGHINDRINAAFNNYACTCIQHFKFIDMRDVIQEDYISIPKQLQKKNSTKININRMNEKMFKTPDSVKDISVLLNIRPKSKPIILPKKRVLNLKNKKFRTKGIVVEKKNLCTKYEENAKKKKAKKKKDKKKKKKKNEKVCVKVEIG
jgi:hypothetical protein